MMKLGKRTATLVTGLSLGIVGAMPSAHAALSITSAGQTYFQDFDSLAATGTNTTNVTWTNNNTLANWDLYTRLAGSQNNGGVVNAFTTANYRVDNGSSNTGWFWSYGTAGSTDRAFGSIASSSSTGYWNQPASGSVAGWIAFSATNNTGSNLSSFTAQYDGEQWRDGGNSTAASQKMTVEYGYGSTFAGVTTWTATSLFDFVSPTFTTTSGGLNGNLAANRVANIGGTVSTTWANGQTLWVRWADVNDNGSDHALAIDNVQFTAGQAIPTSVPLPAAVWLLGAGLGALGWTGRRRSRA